MHNFAFSFLPADTARQRVTSLSVSAPECPNLQNTVGAFGSRRIYGCIDAPHTGFSITVSGTLETGRELFEAYCADPLKNGIFRVQSSRTQPGAAIRGFYDTLPLRGSAYDRALAIRSAVHDAFRYAPGKIAAHESGECAFARREGVCQDYSHVMLSLLRMGGIPARYVTGMMVGEGASHAWVEANCGGYWYGFDPTNDLLVDDHYIRVACGRDSADCDIIRGTFYGFAGQTQWEQVRVEPTRSSYD